MAEGWGGITETTSELPDFPQVPVKSHVRKEDSSILGESKDSPYSHPVYKQLSKENGRINKMTKEQLKQKLAELKMDTRFELCDYEYPM